MVIVLTVFLMSLQDAIIKYASSDLTLWQIYVLRSTLAIPLLFAISAFSQSLVEIVPRSIGWTATRALLLVLMYFCIYAAAPVLSLAILGAAFYTGPLFITLFSWVLLGEIITWRKWLAVLIGFAGVIIIMRPGTEDFSYWILLPILSGLFYALAAITTRARCRDEPVLCLAVSLNVALLVSGILVSGILFTLQLSASEISAYPFLLGNWAVMGWPEWNLIAVLALLIAGIGIGLAKAYQSAPASIIATFDYSYLIFAVFWSLVIFSEPPDVPTIIGMGLIAAGGLLTIQR